MDPFTVDAINSCGVTTDVLRTGAGRPLLFLHSGAAPTIHSSEYLQLLAQSFEVIAPTHPGFGRHNRPKHFRGVDDVAYFYLDLLEKWDLRNVILVGASFGGWVACEMAVRSAARLEHLVLVDPFGIKSGGREDREIADFYAISPADRAKLEYVDPRFATLSYKGKSDEELSVLARGREAEVHYGWQPFMHNPQLIHWLHRIDVPTLLLRGSDDRIVVKSNHEAYVTRISNCRMQIIEKAGHHPHLDAPRDFASAVSAFANGAKQTASIT